MSSTGVGRNVDPVEILIGALEDIAEGPHGRDCRYPTSELYAMCTCHCCRAAMAISVYRAKEANP